MTPDVVTAAVVAGDDRLELVGAHDGERSVSQPVRVGPQSFDVLVDRGAPAGGEGPENEPAVHVAAEDRREEVVANRSHDQVDRGGEVTVAPGVESPLGDPRRPADGRIVVRWAE